MLGGKRRGLAPATEAELVQDPADVVAGGILADDELGRDFLIGETLCDQGQHLPLPPGQESRLSVMLFGRQLPKSVQHFGGNGGVQQRLPAGGRAYGGHELRATSVLEPDSRSPPP